MGRRISVGVATPGGNVGLLSVEANSVVAVDENASLTLEPNGTGNVIITSNIEVQSQSDLRLYDSDDTNYVAVQAPSNVTTNYTVTLPSAVATRDKSVLTSNTSGVTTWEPPKTFEYSVQSTSFNATAFGGYFVDTSSGGVTVTLPASPTMGDSIRILDVARTFDSNACTVARNGQLIQGDAADMTVSSESAAFELVFSNSTYGWRIFSI